MKALTNQWHNYGSVHLAISDHLWVFEIVSGLKSVEPRNLVFTYVIFNMRDVAISPKYNFEKLLRKLTISYFC